MTLSLSPARYFTAFLVCVKINTRTISQKTNGREPRQFNRVRMNIPSPSPAVLALVLVENLLMDHRD